MQKFVSLSSTQSFISLSNMQSFLSLSNDDFMQNFVSYHLVTFESLSHCYNSNLLHFELQVLHCNIKLWVSCCSKKLWILPCCVSRYKFCCCISSYEFSIVTFQITSFVFHQLCFITIFWAWNYFTIVCLPHLVCDNNFRTFEIEPSSFSFLFFPFDWSWIFFMECLWTLCIFFFDVIIFLITIALDFVEASNYNYSFSSSCDFKCVCVFNLGIKVFFFNVSL
jgi:hypothetical protein